MGYRDDPEVIKIIEKVGYDLVEVLKQGVGRSERAIWAASPQQIQEAFSHHVGLGILDKEEGHNPTDVLAAIEDILKLSVQASHPRFFHQCWAGSDPIGILGGWIETLLSTTMATYEMAPVFTLMENEVLARMAVLAGFYSEYATAQVKPGRCGLFAPGGSMSNMYAMYLARTKFEKSDLGHLHKKKMCVLASEQSHYSLAKSASILGLGEHSVVSVPCDKTGSLDIDSLKIILSNLEKENLWPFFWVATAGTTVAAAFDPILEMSRYAKKYEAWFHVDGCLGGSALFSPSQQYLLSGVEFADSLAWNAHKLMGMPQQCAVLLLKNPDILKEAFASGASYLFQPDKPYAEYDLGDFTFQCGRRADVLKLWLTWKVRGESWFAERIDKSVDLASKLEQLITTDSRFYLAIPRTFNSVCFYWLPPDMRSSDSLKDFTSSDKCRLQKIAPSIKAQMHAEGRSLLAYQPLGTLPNMFRLNIISPDVEWKDLTYTLDLIDDYGMKVSSN